jgi:hypothetical protein
VSVLVRAHLRHLAPLPKGELLALKGWVAEVGVIARCLNRLARAANGSGGITGPERDDLWTILKVCEAVRVRIEALTKANTKSWEIGHAEAENG